MHIVQWQAGKVIQELYASCSVEYAYILPIKNKHTTFHFCPDSLIYIDHKKWQHCDNVLGECEMFELVGFRKNIFLGKSSNTSQNTPAEIHIQFLTENHCLYVTHKWKSILYSHKSISVMKTLVLFFYCFLRNDRYNGLF